MRYENVYFDFVSASHAPAGGRGAVVVRGAEMVLDLECAGIPYLIAAKDQGGYYAGLGDGVEVKLAFLGSEFVGLWIEEGDEWFFRFELSGWAPPGSS